MELLESEYSAPMDSEWSKPLVHTSYWTWRTTLVGGDPHQLLSVESVRITDRGETARAAGETDFLPPNNRELPRTLSCMTRIFELTGFQRDLLYVIAGSDRPSGQTIRREMEKHVDNVNHGRLYPNLDALVEYSLIEKGTQDQRTNYYELAESGEDLIERRRQWESQYVSPPQEPHQQ